MCWLVVLLFVCLFILFIDCSDNLIQARIIWEEETLAGKIPPSRLSTGKSVGLFLHSRLMGEDPDHWRQGCPWAGGPGLYKTKQAEQVNKQCSSMDSLVPALAFFDDRLLPVNQINLCSPKLLLLTSFITAFILPVVRK